MVEGISAALEEMHPDVQVALVTFSNRIGVFRWGLSVFQHITILLMLLVKPFSAGAHVAHFISVD